MGDWSNFFKGVGEIVGQVSKAREQYLQEQNKSAAAVTTTTSASIQAEGSNNNNLYPDLRNLSNDEIPAPNPSSEMDVNNQSSADDRSQRRRRNQQRADDEEELEVLGDRRQNRNGGASGGNDNMGTFAALGIAGVALGAYAAYKAYCGKDDEGPLPPLPKSRSECEHILKKFKQDTDEFPVIGLDCQWLINESPYDPRHPVALLQLATHKGNVLLFPLRQLSIPDGLRALLNDSQIVKTGIEVIKDARYLREDYDISIQSTFDLRFLAEDTAHRPEGLEKLSKSVLNLDIGRDWEIIKSHWGQWPLEEKQISYAQTAVKASIDIFTTLYPFTGNGKSKREILNYCNPNKDRQFIWDTRKWD